MYSLQNIGKYTKPYKNREELLQSVITADIPNGTIASDGVVSYVRDHNTHKIPDLPGWLPFGNINPAHFGADYSGTHDAHFSFQLAIDYAQGKLVECTEGTLKINNTINITYDNQVIDLTNCIIDASDLNYTTSVDDWNTLQNTRNPSVFFFKGTEGGTVRVLENSKKNSFVMALDSIENIRVGQGVFINTNQKWYDINGSNINRLEVNRIRKIENKKVFFEFPLSFDYDVQNFEIELFSWTPIKSAHLKGGYLKGGGVKEPLKNGFGQVGVAFKGFENCSITNCRISFFQNKQLFLNKGIGFTARDLTFQGHQDTYSDSIDVSGSNGDSGFYGVFHNSVRNSLVENIIGRRTRHLVDGSNSQDIIALHCVASRSHSEAFTCHPGCTNWTFRECKAFENERGAVSWRGQNVSLIDNYFITKYLCFYTTVRSDPPSNELPIYYFRGNKMEMTIGGKDNKLILIITSVKIHFLNNLIQVSENANVMSFQGSKGSIMYKNNNIYGDGSECHALHIAYFALKSGRSNMVFISDNVFEDFIVCPIKIFENESGNNLNQDINVIVKENWINKVTSAMNNSLIEFPHQNGGIFVNGPNYSPNLIL